MSHQTRRGSECPLASLGRNITVGLDEHNQPQYHPLSSSPLNPQAYQMSRKSLDFNVDTDDIIYRTAANHRNNADSNKHFHRNRADLYHLSRNSSSSLIDLHRQQSEYHQHQLQSPSPSVESSTPSAAGVSASVVCHRRPIPQGSYMPINNILQYDDDDRHQEMISSSSNNNNYIFDDSNRDSSDSGAGGRHNISNVSSSSKGAKTNEMQYFLQNKMDSLYIQGAIRGGLPLGPETNHFQNERYYLEENLRNLCDYNESDHIHQSHLIHRPSSPSETSGSDRYLLDRTTDSLAISAFTSVVEQNSNGYSQSNLAQLEKRFHPTKVKSLSDGLSNLGRFSPSLDQGYATLVSPSPTGGHHQSATTSSSNAAAAATVENVLGLPCLRTQRLPWGKKGPYRSGPVFDRLPDDAVINIFSWLDSIELCNVARVCRRFENLAWRPSLWKIITLKGEFISGDKALKMIFRQLCGQTQNGSCPDVERVMLSDGCRITDKGLLLLTRRCPELTHLQLQSSISVSNQALCDVLSKCTNLQHLDITGCVQMTNISINPNLESQRRLLLQYLDLTDCIAIDDVGLKIVVRNCPQLVYLYLRRCIQITDAGLKFVPSFCIALKELSVSDCINITDFGLYELAKLGAALRYLSVAKCDRVSDAGLKVIARRCYKLRYLNARGCEAVSDDSITVLARSCPRLRALDIGKCDVSDAGLRALAESCPNLKKLSLRNCDMITDRGVQYIAYYCRGLQQLNIQDCQISIEGYRAVKKYCKRCIIEHTNPGFC